MAKKSKEIVSETAIDSQKQILSADIAAENQLLREKVEQLERDNRLISEKQAAEGTQSQYIKEMEEIAKRGDASVSKISYRDIQEYKAVYLYHKNGYNIGKRIGPLHPSNADYAFKEFAKKGIVLTITVPSEEFVAAYKKTAEYQKLAEAFDKKAKADARSSKADSIEKLTEQISKLAGTVVVNRIKTQEEVAAAR